MKKIMILGTCRTGKTTFSKLLQKELENYQIIEVDAIMTINDLAQIWSHNIREKKQYRISTLNRKVCQEF